MINIQRTSNSHLLQHSIKIRNKKYLFFNDEHSENIKLEFYCSLLLLFINYRKDGRNKYK